jgi:hypothetical protein
MPDRLIGPDSMADVTSCTILLDPDIEVGGFPMLDRPKVAMVPYDLDVGGGIILVS